MKVSIYRIIMNSIVQIAYNWCFFELFTLCVESTKLKKSPSWYSLTIEHPVPIILEGLDVNKLNRHAK